MPLRDYQERCIQKIRDAYKNGYKAPILRLDCGAGKTITTITMALKTASRNREVLFLVHRKELLKQTKEALANFPENPNIKVGMILTVKNHLEDYNPYFIICDECNFALAKSWRAVLDHYPDAFKLGLSATPCRLDGKPMGDIFDCIIEDVSAEELIQMGYLSQYDYYAPHINLEDANWQIKGSDFDTEDACKKLDKPQVYGEVLKYCDPNKQTIIYCATVEHSKRMCEILRHNGYNAVHFDAKTPPKERDAIVESFKNKKINFLLNVDLISFGFDAPNCDRVFLLRPTLSTALYIQQAMRCLRPYEGKRAEIYDFVGNVYRHGLPTEKREWSLTGKIKAKNPDGEPELIVRQCKECLRVYKGNGRLCPYCGHDNGKTRQQIKEEEKVELEKITALEKKKKHMEVGMARSLNELIEIGKQRGYKNPRGWAMFILRGREKKKRSI